MRFGLFPKFLSVMVSLAIIPILFFAYRATHVSKVNIENSVMELHTKLAEKMAGQIDVYFNSIDHQMVFLFSCLQKNLTWEDKSELMNTLMSTNPDVQEISFLTAQGKEVLRFPAAAAGAAPVSWADDPGFQQFQTGRKRTFWPVSDPPSMDIYYPLANNNMAGHVRVSLARLADSIAMESVGGTGFAVMMNREGAPIFLPEDRLDKAIRQEMPKWALVQSALQAPGVVSERIEGRDLLGAAQSLSTIGGALLILQTHSEAYAGVREMQKSSIIALIVVGLVALAGAAFLAKRLTLPLLALTAGAETVSQGKFDTQINVETRDELQDLAETFNKMTRQLRAYADMQVDRLVLEQQKNDAILFSIADGILMTDAEDAIQLVNRRARELLGFTQEIQLNGKIMGQALPPSKLRDVIVRGAGSGQGKGYVDVDLSTPTRRRFLRVTQQPVFSPRTKGILGLVTGLHDATAEKELERMKNDFLRSVTAEIRAPLAYASQHVQSLMSEKSGPLAEAQKRSLSNIMQALTLQMISVCNAFDIANVDSGKVSAQLAQARLSDVASRAIRALQPLANERKLALSLSGGAEPPIVFDAALIERVLMNLIFNAVKFTSSGSITVTVSDAAASQQVTVADTGIGIPANHLQRIFIKFERVAGVQGGGLGLGLAVAKSFLEAHSGKIWADSQPQKGSRFCFTIPKNLSPSKPEAAGK